MPLSTISHSLYWELLKITHNAFLKSEAIHDPLISVWVIPANLWVEHGYDQQKIGLWPLKRTLTDWPATKAQTHKAQAYSGLIWKVEWFGQHLNYWI